MTMWGYGAGLVLALLCGGLLGAVLVRRGMRSRAAPHPATAAELGRQTLDSLDNGIVLLNRRGEVVLHNPRAVEFGVVVGGRADERAGKAAEQVVKTGQVMELDLSPLSPTGRQPAAVRAEVRPLAGDFVVVDAADESDSVRLEKTRRDFVANVSHELKTPVGALALLAEAVQGCADEPEEVLRFSEKIRHEATRMGTLVTELISLSRLEGAEALPDLNVVDVDGLITEACGRTRLAAESAGIRVVTEGTPGLQLRGDRTLLITALANLVDNAVSYSATDRPVTVTRRSAGGMVEIAVTDCGIGIAPKHQARVFERFYRVDKARSRATGGTGLGLAIVKHVAANHGGEVTLRSEPGAGSTFTLRIPMHEPTRRVTPKPAGPGGPEPARTDYEGVS